MTRMVKASEFETNCHDLMNHVVEDGEVVVITRDGKPVARLVPVEGKSATLFGVMRDRIQISGDIIEPIDVDWAANH